MSTRLFALVVAAFPFVLSACIFVEEEPEQNPFGPNMCTDAGLDAPADPCESVRTWCPTPFTWDEDPTGRCYCACTNEMICDAAPGKPNCGILLTLPNPDQIENIESPWVRFFPEGFPFVCRIDEDEVPDSPIVPIP